MSDNKRDARPDPVLQLAAWYVQGGRKLAAKALGKDEKAIVVTPDGVFCENEKVVNKTK
jgi:hypothetical protein